MIAPFMFIVLVLFGHGMGIGEYFNDNLWTWDEAPLICGLMSDYDKQMANAFGAWKSALLSIDDKWDVTFLLIDPSSNEDFAWCEAYVIIVAEEHTDHATTQGKDCCMWGIVQGMGTNKLVAYIFEERDITRFDISFQESIERTIKHEVGHIFGLGHWEPKGMADALKPWPDIIMWKFPHKDMTGKISEYELLALQTFYGSDGWGLPNNGKVDTYHAQIPYIGEKEKWPSGNTIEQ